MVCTLKELRSGADGMSFSPRTAIKLVAFPDGQEPLLHGLPVSVLPKQKPNASLYVGGLAKTTLGPTMLLCGVKISFTKFGGIREGRFLPFHSIYDDVNKT